MKSLRNPATLKDVLQNLAPDSGANEDYICGVVVGAVSALTAAGFDFDQALLLCADYQPSSAREAVPPSWAKHLARLQAERSPICAKCRMAFQSRDRITRAGDGTPFHQRCWRNN